MASIITELDTFGPTVTAPDDGDTAGAASVTAAGVGFQELANRTLYLKNRNVAAVGGRIVVPLVANEVLTDTWTFQRLLSGTLGTYLQDDVSVAGEIWFPIPHQLGATLTGITIGLNGNAGTGGPHVGLPATMPQVSIRETNGLTGVNALIGTQIDTSASFAAYDVAHDVILTVAAQVFDEDSVFWAVVEGEAGANALINTLNLYRIYAQIAAV